MFSDIIWGTLADATSQLSYVGWRFTVASSEIRLSFQIAFAIANLGLIIQSVSSWSESLKLMESFHMGALPSQLYLTFR